jgi:hypothetical protein
VRPMLGKELPKVKKKGVGERKKKKKNKIYLEF